MNFLRNVLLVAAASAIVTSATRSVLDTIREDEDFSSFRSLLFRYDAASLLQDNNVTVFVPTNAAFQKYRGVLDRRILLNHVVNWTLALEELDSRTRIVTQENYPTLWVTRGRDFVFVNGAKIDLERSKYIIVARTDAKLIIQVLYVLDEVLAPVLVTPNNKPAKAIDFIQSRLRDFSHFFSAIIDTGAASYYTSENRYTYFVPVNTKFSGLFRNKIDLSVIRGHIVPYHALFTRPSEKNFPFPTIYQSSLNVVLSFFVQGEKLLVESAVFRNGTTTTTTAEIMEANIPVDNGVVHVINTTLVVASHTTNMFPYLTMDYKLSGDPSLSFSNTLAEKAGFSGILSEDVQLTFFVPRNEAWFLYSEKGKRVLEYCARIFFRKQMVVGETAYTLKDLELLSQSAEVTLHSLGGMLSLRVVREGDDYFLVWKNKTVRVYKGDYSCVNGFVHVVDEPFLTECDLISCRKVYAAHLRKVTKKWQ